MSQRTQRSDTVRTETLTTPSFRPSLFPFRTITSVTRWLLVVVGCAVLAMAQPMSAAPTDTPAEKPASPDQIIYPKNSPERSANLPAENHAADTSRMLIVFVALALAGTGAWVLIQRRQAGPASGRGQRKLQIDETRPLGNRQYLVVADYDGKKFLLGVAPGQIRLLTPLDAARDSEKKS